MSSSSSSRDDDPFPQRKYQRSIDMFKDMHRSTWEHFESQRIRLGLSDIKELTAFWDCPQWSETLRLFTEHDTRIKKEQDKWKERNVDLVSSSPREITFSEAIQSRRTGPKRTREDFERQARETRASSQRSPTFTEAIQSRRVGPIRTREDFERKARESGASSQQPSVPEAVQPDERERRRREIPQRPRTLAEAFAPPRPQREVEEDRNLAVFSLMNAVAGAFRTLEATPPVVSSLVREVQAPPPVVLSHEIRRSQATREEDNDVAAPGCTKFPTKEQANQDVETEDNEAACVVCLVKKACCVADPCGHHHTCATCSRTLCKAKKNSLVPCPTCRNKVEKFMKVYS